MERGNLLGSLVYEKRVFTYTVANDPYARIEVLDFLDGSYGSQAEILATGEKVAISTLKESILEALRAIYPLIEEQIKDDDHVIKTQDRIKRDRENSY